MAVLLVSPIVIVALAVQDWNVSVVTPLTMLLLVVPPLMMVALIVEDLDVALASSLKTVMATMLLFYSSTRSIILRFESLVAYISFISLSSKASSFSKYWINYDLILELLPFVPRSMVCKSYLSYSIVGLVMLFGLPLPLPFVHITLIMLVFKNRSYLYT